MAPSMENLSHLSPKPRIPPEGEDLAHLSWISPLDVKSKKDEILSKRISGTLNWILQAPELEAWVSRNSKPSILWCNGLPGMGTTTLTTVIIDHLQKTVTEQNEALAYVYCDYYNKGLGALEILSSICRQLASQCANIPPQLLKLHSQMTAEDERPGIDDVMLAVVSMCDSFAHVFIVIDAICELPASGERPILISKLQWIRNHGARVLVTSATHGERPEACKCNDDIAQAFEGEEVLTLRSREEDVWQFLMDRLEAHGKEDLFPEAGLTADQVVKKIVADSGGVFRVAELMLERKIRQLHEVAGQNAHLDETATDLQSEPLLEGIKRIQEQSPLRRDLAMDILSWVIHAIAPLRLHALVQAVSISSKHRFRLWVRDSDAGVAGDEVRRLIKDKHMAGSRGDEAAVTEQEPLISLFDICEHMICVTGDDCQVKLSGDWHLSPAQRQQYFPQAQFQIANVCLRFLQWDPAIEIMQFDEKRTAEDKVRLQSTLPLHWYARNHWDSHYSACEDEGIDIVAIEFYRKIYQRPAGWIEKREQFFGNPYYVAITDDETPLLKTARLGLNRLLEKLLDSGDYGINDESWRDQSAMSVAVENSHYSTVQFLYRRGASIHHKNQNGHSLLHTAAEKNDEIMVALLYNCGLDTNTVSGRNSETPLHMAAQKNSVNAGKVLLDSHADMLAQTRSQGVAAIAAQAGHLEFVKLLVERGCKLSNQANWSSPLVEAIRSGSVPLVQYMLAHGADVHEKDNRKRMAIHTAAQEGNIEMVKELINRGADPFVEDDGPNDVCEGSSALGEAVRMKHHEVVKFLLPGLGAHVPREVILGMAVAAAQAQSPELFRLFLDKVPGELVYWRKQFRDTLLGAAMVGKDEEILEILLEREISTTTQDQHGWTALHFAAYRGLEEPTWMLIQRGAGLDIQTNYGMTALHIAAYSGKIGVMKALLEYDADLCKRADDGTTALVAAAYGSQPEAVRLLLKHVALISDFNMDGETALHHAVMDNDAELVQDLLEHGIDVAILSRRAGSALHLAACKGYIEIVKKLLDFGADPELAYKFHGEAFEPPEEYGFDGGVLWNQAGIEKFTRPKFWISIEPGWTALHTAACGGSSEVVKLLVERGAVVSSKGLGRETAMHIAASACHTDVIKVLLDHGANISDKMDAGNTALHAAAFANMAVANQKTADHFKCACHLRDEAAAAHGHEDHSKSDCIELLLKRGADPAVENELGLTPLAMAVGAGHEDIVKAILKHVSPKTLTGTIYVKLLQHCDPKAPAEVLEMVSDVVEETEESKTAWNVLLSRACVAGNQDMVSLSLRRGAIPSTLEDGTNPFLQAIEDENAPIVKLLLESGANPNDTDQIGHAALHIACSHAGKRTLTVNHESQSKELIAGYLISHGAETNAKALDGDTALHYAVVTGRIGLVKLLLRNDASVNIRNNRGSTPLHAAVSEWVFPDIVECLIQNGASTSTQNKIGYTPLHLIRARDDEGVRAAEILLQNGCDALIRARNGDMASHTAIRRGNWAVFKRLLEAGVSLDAVGAKGRNVVHLAAKYGHSSFIEHLIKMGAKVDVVDREGCTPMDYARIREDMDMVKLLSGHDASKPTGDVIVLL